MLPRLARSCSRRRRTGDHVGDIPIAPARPPRWASKAGGAGGMNGLCICRWSILRTSAVAHASRRKEPVGTAVVDRLRAPRWRDGERVRQAGAHELKHHHRAQEGRFGESRPAPPRPVPSRCRARGSRPVVIQGSSGTPTSGSQPRTCAVSTTPRSSAPSTSDRASDPGEHRPLSRGARPAAGPEKKQARQAQQEIRP